jgi:hypothetical protein
MLFYLCCSELLDHRARTGRGPLRFFPGAENQEPGSTWRSKMITVHEKMYPRPSSPYRSRSCCRTSVVEKLRAAWVKMSTAGVLRLRATSAVSRDKSVRRSAQDDDFVGVLTKNSLNKLNKLALMDVAPRPHFLNPRKLGFG